MALAQPQLDQRFVQEPTVATQSGAARPGLGVRKWFVPRYNRFRF